MTETELKKIMQMESVAVIAPAGHGKTEMIADIVNASVGKQLLLTHTNAGVAAIERRLQKRGIPKTKYTVTTIAAFCIKWCLSYVNTSTIDISLSPYKGGEETKKYYAQMYNGAKRIFEHKWAGAVLRATYVGIVVDEYQDCVMAQHELVLTMNNYLPVRVFGDPMQGIMGFTGDLVDWSRIEFPIVTVDTKPWRWEKCNPDLGKYLMEVRENLKPILQNQRCQLQISPRNSSVEVIPTGEFTGYSHLRELSRYSTVVYITRWPPRQLEICRSLPGIFQYDEKQECDELFKYSGFLDKKDGAELLLAVVGFAKICMTGVSKELKPYIDRLKTNDFDFSRIRKNTDFRDIIEENTHNPTKDTVLKLLQWFSGNSAFKKYRTELLSEMIRTVKYAIDKDITYFEAANHIRKDSALQKHYTGFRFLSSRTSLSKGLEFDCVVIDMRDPLPAKDFYVAMTRAMKKIYIISDSNVFSF